LFLIHSARLPIQNNDFSAVEGDLIIAAASSEKNWTNWKIVHVENGPFVNEMLCDPIYWEKEGTLSVMVQEMSEEKLAPSALRVLDFLVR
jgi:hypothetical protein